MARPDYERLRNVVESFMGRTRQALERGLDDLQKEARVGKVKLLDIYQLRRERGRLFQRLGEEVFALVREGSLEVPALQRLVSRIEALDEKIQAKETEVDELREDEAPDSARTSAPSGDEDEDKDEDEGGGTRASGRDATGSSGKKRTSKKKKSSGKKKKKSSGSDKKKKRTLGPS